MKKVFYAVLFFTIFSCGQQSPIAEVKDLKVIVKEQADSMAITIKTGDYRNFVKYAHPKIIELMGGPDKTIEAMDKGFLEMENRGEKFIDVKIEMPSEIISKGEELQCTLGETLELKVSNGRLISKSTLIAISQDKGKTWYFVDANGNSLAKIKEIIPSISEKLIIPPATEPELVKE